MDETIVQLLGEPMRIVSCIALSLLVSATSAFADKKSGKIVKANFVEPTLINGRPANPAEFPASVYASMGGGRCTGTVVGPQVMIIAAHCVSSGGTASFNVGPNRYSSVCTHSRDYASNATADYALCKVDKVVTGIKYEEVLQDASLLKVGSELLLTGYGCTRPGGTGGNDGVYRIGEAKITKLPAGTNNDIVTEDGGALCFGDSGGPAFVYTDTAKQRRLQVSVNSRGDIATTSYLSALYTTQGKRFLNAWLEREAGMQICGVTPNTPNCRNDEVQPSPPPEGNKCAAEINEAIGAKAKLDEAFGKMTDCLAKD